MLLSGSSFRRIVFAPMVALFALSSARGETAPRPVEPASAPAPSVEQCLASLKAYFANSDPTSALKNARGETPAELSAAVFTTTATFEPHRI